jgi:TRAP transporter TAXI family solute receptor
VDISVRSSRFGTILVAALCAQAGGAFAAAEYKVVTANQTGTYYAIGADLAKFVAPDADISLEVLPSAGSAANIKHLRYDLGVKFAIVQADVFQAFLDRAAEGNSEAATIIKPLRVITPLYNTEIHYVVRADSPLNYLHDIKDARINGGILGSGAALITHTLYRMMFAGPIPEPQASYLSNEEALVKLIGDKSVDVVVVAAGQPAPLIAGMRPEAQKYVKFLKFDPNHASSKQPLTVYTYSTVNVASYPNILTEPFTTIAVGAYLVTYDYNLNYTVSHLTKFARSLCQNFRVLQDKGHPKWREVKLNLPDLGPGWTYYQPTSRAIRACTGRADAAPTPKTGKACKAEERILGLCR